MMVQLIKDLIWVSSNYDSFDKIASLDHLQFYTQGVLLC
jgi:hypothetical protein